MSSNVELTQREKFALSIKTIRKSLDMTEEELAKKAGYKTPSYIIAIENGSSPIAYDKVKDIANALGVSLNQVYLRGKIKINEQGWPILSREEEIALHLFAPLIKNLPSDDIDYITKMLLICNQAENVMPEWNKTEFQKNAK